MARVFISVGSNIDPEKNVLRALTMLASKARILAVSTFYLTEPHGGVGQPSFHNGVVEIETGLLPIELKHSVLRAIEDRMGRVRTDDKCVPRAIDLDVLVYDDLVMEAEDLAIPDPQISDRAFLAVPLCELAPDLILPGTSLSMEEIAARFEGHAMQPLREYTERLRDDLLITQ